MYLTRMILNPRSRRVQREVAEPYQMHRSLMQAFPDHLDEQERILFRLEIQPRTNEMTLLVQSQGMPDWSWLGDENARGYLLPSDEPNPWVKPFNPRLSTGESLAFRLRANPTVKRGGKRRGLYTEEEQRAWLERKSQAGGFRVLGVRIQVAGFSGGVMYKENERHNLRLLSVQYDGLLQITHVEKFLYSLKQGIGSGKGLGFGLLSIAPPQAPI